MAIIIETYNFSVKVLDTITQQIAVIDKIGNIVYVNKSWIEFNKNNDGLIKPTQWKNINYLSVSDDAANAGDSIALEASKGIKSVIKGELPDFYLQYPCSSPDEERWFIMSVTQFEDNGNNYFVLSHQDITKRKIAEDIMIRQSQQASMFEILCLVGHHWKQPLSVLSAITANVLLSSSMQEYDLTKTEDSLSYEKHVNSALKKINKITKKMSNLINNFTYFAKTDKSKQTVTLEEVCNQALGILKTSLFDNNIEVVYDYDSGPEYELITTEIIQAIFNIVKNSKENFKNKKIQNPKIKITASKNTISICDNGGGIADDIIDKIFDPYFSTKVELNGTGLGLYLAKVIVEIHHNGKLLVENKNSGVCFKIILNN